MGVVDKLKYITKFTQYLVRALDLIKSFKHALVIWNLWACAGNVRAGWKCIQFTTPRASLE